MARILARLISMAFDWRLFITFVLLALFGVKKLLVFGGIVITLAIIVNYLTSEKCPRCSRRGTISYIHPRKDGGPDRRYKYNPRRCRKCGYIADDWIGRQ